MYEDATALSSDDPLPVVLASYQSSDGGMVSSVATIDAAAAYDGFDGLRAYPSSYCVPADVALRDSTRILTEPLVAPPNVARELSSQDAEVVDAASQDWVGAFEGVLAMPSGSLEDRSAKSVAIFQLVRMGVRSGCFACETAYHSGRLP
jgi:hypothetical protein